VPVRLVSSCPPEQGLETAACFKAASCSFLCKGTNYETDVTETDVTETWIYRLWDYISSNRVL